MLANSHFELTLVDEFSKHEICDGDIDFVNMSFDQLSSFRMLHTSEDFVVCKNGNVYLKSDNDIRLQAFIGKKLNELSSPYFCHTFGLCKTHYHLLSFDDLDYGANALFCPDPHPQFYLCTKDVEGIGYAEFFKKILQNENFEKILISVFIQGVMALYDAYIHLNFSHGDLHYKNVIFKEKGKEEKWAKIGKENVYCEEWMPVFIDFGSSFVKIDEKVYTCQDPTSISVHNNYSDIPNNLGDIFRFYYSLFAGRKPNKISEHLISPNFDINLIFAELNEKYWITPKSRDFNFHHFVDFLKKEYSEFFSSLEEGEYEMQKETSKEMILDSKNGYFPEIHLYNLLLYCPQDGIEMIEQLLYESSRKSHVYEYISGIIENVVLDYPLPFEIYKKIKNRLLLRTRSGEIKNEEIRNLYSKIGI